MLEVSPAPRGTKAACLLINSKNITVQMLIFFPCHFPLQNTPFPNCFAALLPVRPRWDSTGGARHSQQPPPQAKDAKIQSEGLPCEGRTWLYLQRAPGNLLPSDFMFSGTWTHLIMNFPCLGPLGLRGAQGREDAPVIPEPGRESKQGFHVET